MGGNTGSLNAAAGAYREGRVAEAIQILRKVLVESPGNLDAAMLLGVIQAKDGDPEAAIPFLIEVVQQAPASFDALYWLASSYRRLGRPQEALSYAERAVALNPRDPRAIHQLGLCWMGTEDWASAESAFHKAAKLVPNVASIQFSLGAALEQLGRLTEAVRAFRRAIALNPSHIDALFRLGQIRLNDLDYPGAAEYADRILAIDKDSVTGHLLAAATLVGMNRPEEATQHVARALELEPENSEALALSGEILQLLGSLSGAEQRLRRSIEIDPRQGYAYYALVRMRTFGEDDLPFLDWMVEVSNDPRLSAVHRGDLEFALGKVYGDLGRYAEAMKHFDVANRLTRISRYGEARFDPGIHRQGTDFTLQNIDAGFLARYRNAGLSDPLPIFVVGMIRSGTTLAEQILSSHPGVGAAGEQRYWPDQRTSALDPPGNALNQDRVRDLASNYLALLRSLAPGKERVVDKMPANYANLGMIHVALPNARIVHIRRHPIDTCLSIWSTPNATRMEWANDKRAIVFAYRDYLRLMEHWRLILPKDRLIEIDYEDLVSNREGVTRRLLSFCGLEWDEACLYPEANPRPIATPSAWQARQPVHTQSVARWRHFEPWLEEFRELLPPDPS